MDGVDVVLIINYKPQRAYARSTVVILCVNHIIAGIARYEFGVIQL